MTQNQARIIKMLFKFSLVSPNKDVSIATEISVLRNIGPWKQRSKTCQPSQTRWSLQWLEQGTNLQEAQNEHPQWYNQGISTTALFFCGTQRQQRKPKFNKQNRELQMHRPYILPAGDCRKWSFRWFLRRCKMQRLPDNLDVWLASILWLFILIYCWPILLNSFIFCWSVQQKNRAI